MQDRLQKMGEIEMKETVLVGMSGGVDSSVAAALLLEQGYNVIGFTLDLWRGKQGGEPETVRDGRKVASQLGIPHYVLDLRDTFQREIVDYFLQEYASARTPNPCVMCNRKIKFGEVFQVAKKLGADYVATGHYVRLEREPATGRYLLKVPSDWKKDQTYMLYHLTQEQLAHMKMPLGTYTKGEVRELAKAYGLFVADKADSQDICFLEGQSLAEFIQQHDPKQLQPGKVVDEQGNILGEHQGISRYTLGQRRGLGIASDAKLYVKTLDAEQNQVVLGTEESLFAPALIAEDIHFMWPLQWQGELEVEAKIRYASRPAPAKLKQLPDATVLVTFAQRQRAITPGQAVVFYQGDTLVGGGTIRCATDQEYPK